MVRRLDLSDILLNKGAGTPPTSFEGQALRLPRKAHKPSQLTRIQEEATLAQWRKHVTSRYGAYCPCCGEIMNTPVEGKPSRWNTRTKGHTRAKGHTSVPNNVRFWIWMCYRCNNDQRDLSLKGWLHELKLRGDPRAAYVDQLKNYLVEIGVPERYW